MIQGISYYHGIVGIPGVLSAARAKITGTQSLLCVNRPDIKFPLHLRIPSSDVPTFSQIFKRKEYDFDARREPKFIVDAGANIGLASIYFANRFPEAKIIAIEPEKSNYDLLEKNVSPYKNVVPVQAALWHEDCVINLVDPALGNSGFMTQTTDNTENALCNNILHEVKAMTVDTLMKDHGFPHIDILKMDIEGAELEVFSTSSTWIDKVDALIVELHERMKPGCNRSFYNGTNGFDDEWSLGENIYLARSKGCLAKRTTCRS